MRPRLKAVTEELKAHAQEAAALIAQRRENLLELQKKEKAAAERLAETELRHEVGEYDEGQWSQVHKDALADLGAVRDELMDVERDITRLEELDELVKAKPLQPRRGQRHPDHLRSLQNDGRRQSTKLAFLKSVTEDDRTPSPGRASGAQYQPDEVLDGTPLAPIDENAPVEKTLKCKECGTMNVATEWYCEKCGGSLAAM